MISTATFLARAPQLAALPDALTLVCTSTFCFCCAASTFKVHQPSAAHMTLWSLCALAGWLVTVGDQ